MATADVACVRDIRAAGQHVTLTPPNYEMAGQALLGSAMPAILMLLMDDRAEG
jgi:indole-3-acetate monooxygenase